MTLNSDCEKLDAYLAGDLSGDHATCFESHLEECAACREAIDEQKWIDGLLQSSARVQLEPPPAMILDSVRSSLARRRRRVLQAACGLAAAAVLVVAVGWLELNRQAMHTESPEQCNVAVIAMPAPGQPPATFVATSDAIAVPLESSSDDVSIVQVYPTTEAERRWRIELALTSSSTKPNGG